MACEYRDTSLTRKCSPLGPYSRTVPGSLMVVLEVRAFFYWRGSSAEVFAEKESNLIGASYSGGLQKRGKI